MLDERIRATEKCFHGQRPLRPRRPYSRALVDIFYRLASPMSTSIGVTPAPANSASGAAYSVVDQ